MKRVAIAILFLLPTIAVAQPLWSLDGGVAEIDQVLLDGILAKTTRQFSLPVDGREFQVEVQEVSAPNLGVTSLRGRIDKNPDSFFLLCRTEAGATIAFFQPGDGTAYRLDHTGGRDAVRPVDYEKLGECAGSVKLAPDGQKIRHPQPATRAPGFDKVGEVADDGSRHDILIGYTPRAELVMGGWDFIRAEAQLAVNAANLTYVNSGIPSYLRLVHVMATDYEENTAWTYINHAEYLLHPADGRMDNMLPMREAVGADFVSVLIDGRDVMGDVPTCGVAPVMGADDIIPEFEYLAVSIVSVQCATDNWTLAHEVGHNRGCAHNREDVSVHGAYPYAYGNRYFGDDNVGYRTVMSYNDSEHSFIRIPYFANPDISYGGAPTGVTPGLVGQSHNTLTTNNTAALCAGFRAERTFVEFGWFEFSNGLILFPYPSIAQAVFSSREGGTIVLKNSKPSFLGVMEEARSYIYEGNGSATLGGS